MSRGRKRWREDVKKTKYSMLTHIALVWVGGSDFKNALTLLSWQAIPHQLGFGGGAEAKKARKWYALATNNMISEMVCFHCYIQGRKGKNKGAD